MSEPSIDHPGQYVRSHVIPKGMSVTKAAETIGVGRPALSNFLNGKAALSAQMAAKLERAFGTDAQDLMRRQAAYDSAQRPDAAAVSVTTRTFVPPFLMAKANDLVDWANANEARELLAVLLRTLINSTCGRLKLVDFPGNDDAQRPGWDGQVETTEGNPWVPEGVSKWEFGTDRDITKKANKEYRKRTQNTNEAERQRTAFVFVTPRRWHAKANWLHDRKAEGQWRTVHAWDASDLEQWLEQSIPAQVWFGSHRGLAMDGVKSLDRCWIEWCADCEPRFTEDVFAEAISAFEKKIRDHLRHKSGSLLRIVADSRQEGLAFLSTLLRHPKEALQGYADQVAVFTEPGPLSKLAVGSPGFIPVVTSTAVERELAQSGCKLTGFTIEPRTAVAQESSITLNPLSDHAFTVALEAMGLDSERIRRLERASGRSLTVLRRQLARSEAIRSPEWSSNEPLAGSLVPLMLAGAWVANKDADQFLMTELAGIDDYDQLESNFARLLNLEDSPVWSVGGFRGVVSKFDALSGVHQWMTGDQIDRFIEIAELVLSERDPALDLDEDQRWAASVYGKAREVSSPLRKGIAESLVLLSVHGDRLIGSRLPISPERKVASLICRLLEPMTPDRLKSQSSHLQLYAEAAPEAFLDIIERDLSQPDAVVASLMQPIHDEFQGNDRVGLLWALELLAWRPEWLDRVVALLAKLADFEPNDNWLNKPSESLHGIFRFWMPQTAAPVDQRIAVFGRLARTHPAIAWRIAASQFGSYQRAAFQSQKPRWRDYAIGYGNRATNDDARTFISHCIEVCLCWPSHTRDTLADMMKSAGGFSSNRLAQLEEVVAKWAGQARDEDRAWLRERIRVSMRRGKRRASRSAVAGEAADQSALMARRVFDFLEPTDVVWKHVWLFESPYVEESYHDLEESRDELDEETIYAERAKRVQKLRTKAMREVISRAGNHGVLTLALSGNAEEVCGWSVAKAIEAEDARQDFVRTVLEDADILVSSRHQALIRGFLNGMGEESAVRTIEGLWPELTEDTNVKLLCLGGFDRFTWSYAQKKGETVLDSYWAKVQPSWGGLHAADDLNDVVSQLLEAGRPRAALDYAHILWRRVESSHIHQILTELPYSNEAHYPGGGLAKHHVQGAFKVLNERGTLTQVELARLEFLYIDIFWLDDEGVSNLQKEIEASPELFYQMIALAYRREGEDAPPEPTETERNLAQKAYKLLDRIVEIPGYENSSLRADKLKNWISNVRELCNTNKRQRVGDHHIGQLLSNAPEGEDRVWPCEPVREVLEDILNADIEEGFIVGRRNSRGAQLRGSGGSQERDLAAECEVWARACEYSTPKVAKALRRLVADYESEARWWDQDAAVQGRLGY